MLTACALPKQETTMGFRKEVKIGASEQCLQTHNQWVLKDNNQIPEISSLG